MLFRTARRSRIESFVIKVTSSFIWTFLQQGSSKIINLAIEIMLARLLCPEAFGVLAILTVFVQLADGMSRSGLNMALVQREEATERDFSTGFWLAEGIACVSYVLVFLVAPFIANFYSMLDLEIYLKVFSLVLFINAFNSIQRAYLQRKFAFKGIFLASFISVVLSGICGIIAAASGLGTWALVIQAMVASVASCVVFAFAVPWRPKFEFDSENAKSLFSFGWQSCVVSMINNLYSSANNLIIGKVCSSAELGLYNRGSRYPSAVVGVIGLAAADVLLPAFSRLQNDQKKMVATVRKALLLGCFFVAPMAICMAIVAEPLVILMLGETWLSCVPIFQFTSLGLAVCFLQTVNQRIYLAMGRSDIFMVQELVKIAISAMLVITSALIFRNIYIISFATLIAMLICVIGVDMHSSRKVIGYGRFSQLKDVASIYVCAIVAALPSTMVISGLSFPIAQLLVSVTVYMLTYWFLNRLFRTESLGYLKIVVESLEKKIRTKQNGGK